MVEASWVVWKHELLPGSTYLDLHVDAEILTVGAQGERVFLWERHTDGESHRSRAFLTVGTGQKWAFAFGRYVGTSFMGPLVWHTFEEEFDAG